MTKKKVGRSKFLCVCVCVCVVVVVVVVVVECKLNLSNEFMICRISLDICRIN